MYMDLYIDSGLLENRREYFGSQVSIEKIRQRTNQAACSYTMASTISFCSRL